MDEDYQGGFDLISADIEKSYVRQNLPIRRQSLIVLHDQLNASNEPKLHSEFVVSTDKPVCIKLSNIKTLNHVAPTPAPSSPEKAVPKLIGLLSPSKSESSKKESWNDMSQPLSKLKSVFSRLHQNETILTTSKRNTSHCSHDLKKKKKSSGKNHAAGIIYTALLSHVSKGFLKKIQLSTINEYHDVFSGTMAVVSDGITNICNTTNCISQRIASWTF